MSNSNTMMNPRFMRKLRWIERIVPTLLIAIAGVIGTASAQTLPMTFSASVTSGDGELSTTLTWDAPGASHCIAAGHEHWSGQRLASGVEVLPTITLSGTYQISLTCVRQGDTSTVLTWTNTTLNTDGTPLLDPKLIRLRWGDTATTMHQVTDVPMVGAALPSTFTYTGVPPGERWYAAYTVNQRDVESAASNMVSKQSTETVSRSETIALTINPIPGEPLNLAAKDAEDAQP